LLFKKFHFDGLDHLKSEKL